MRFFRNHQWHDSERDSYSILRECYKCQFKIVDPTKVAVKSLTKGEATLVSQINPSKESGPQDNSYTFSVETDKNMSFL